MIFAQQSDALLQQAKTHINNFEYKKAARILEPEAKKRNAKPEVLELLVECYRIMDNKDRAAFYLRRMNENGQYKPEHYLHYGELLLHNGNYEEAKLHFQIYAGSTHSIDPHTQLLIHSCDTAMLWLQHKGSSVFEVTNVSRINSKYNDWGAVPLQDSIIFVSNRPTHRKSSEEYNVFQSHYSKSKKDALTTPVLLKELIKKGHIGPVIYSSNGRIYYTQTSLNVSKKNKFEGGQVWENKLEIKYARVSGGKLSDIKSFQYNNPRHYSVGHPCLSPNDSILYFVSDMPGGYGGTDIYYSELDSDGKWSPPINAGPRINSADNEMFPTMDTTGILYFSSNGRVGFGGLDIYRAQGAKNTWTIAENLRYPINSSGDDFFLTFIPGTNRSKGYLSSNRPGGVGYDDIYAVTMNGLYPDVGHLDKPTTYREVIYPEKVDEESPIPLDTTAYREVIHPEKVDKEIPIPLDTPAYREMIHLEREVILTGSVIDQETKKPLGEATISFVNDKTKEQIIVTTDTSGTFSVPLDRELTYVYSCIHKGYIPSIKQTLAGNNITQYANGIYIVMTPVKTKEENIIAANVILDTGQGTGVEYSVQVMASKEYPDWDYLNKILEAYADINIYYYYGSFPDTYTRFTVGRMKTLKEATKLKNELRKLGYHDAFVVMFIDGKRKVVSYN
jgi:hypothetical protein